MAIKYYAGPRGAPGFLVGITNTAGNVDQTVIPAYVPVDATGAVISGGGGGGGASTIADGADVAEGATTATAYSDGTGAAAGTVVGALKGLYVVQKAGVQGIDADAATVTAKPVGIGATFLTTLPTYTTGQRTSLQTDLRGNLRVIPTLSSVTPSSGGVTVGLSYSNTSTTGVPLAALGYVWNGANTIPSPGDANGAWSKSPPLAHTASAVVAGSTASQQLFAASAARSKLLVQNQDATIIVYVNLGGAATAAPPSFKIAPGSTLELNGTNESVNLIAASGTPAIAAWQF